ncbi:MAG: 3-hydroxyacyl-ACP dehydratase FabZ [bacterium]|nr:3-hydroxyacyl-ACP dehydratase FabZ [bacterium]
MDVREIMTVLPHRYPFLLIDRVLEIEEKRVRALKNVTINEPFFAGHFPGAPVMPGVLLVEAMAQTAGCLLLEGVEDRESKLIYFSGIDNCRFRRPVVPGDQIIFDLEVRNVRRAFAKMHGVATVDGELACEADLMSAMVDRE